ncbi:hypothetical protein [Marisediminicola sp. LYQ85]|uniref:hypothetical protein n=1 Tax=Marisediminicola sp. LYQ85 TaxID=3391062 RepID=UPI0039830F35
MSKKTNTALVLGGVPRADLLPPEVHARAKSRRTRQMLAIAVVSALAAVGGTYAAATLRTASAQMELAAEQERTAQLLAEQLLYADATTIAGLVSTVSDARTLAVSTEVLWGDLTDQIVSYLPDGVTLSSGTLTSRAPWEAELVPAGPLRYAHVARMSIVFESASVIDVTDLVRRMSALTGFTDATPDILTYADGVYSTTIAVTVDADALSGRFGADSEGGEPDDATSDGADAPVEGAVEPAAESEDGE